MKQLIAYIKHKNWQVIILVFVALILFSASFPEDKKHRAKAGQEQVFVIDGSQSQIFWHVDAHSGIIPLCEGELVMQGNALVDAQFRVCMDSLRNLDIDYDLMRAVFENTIKSKEVFHTERFPYGYFSLCCTENLGNDSLHISGDLILKDIEHCIRFNSFFQLSGDSIQANTDTIYIDRTNWGIFAMTKKHSKSENSYIVSDTIQFQINLYGKLKNE